MKLLNQINIAFAFLIIFLFIIMFLLMNNLFETILEENQRGKMREQAEAALTLQPEMETKPVESSEVVFFPSSMSIPSVKDKHEQEQLKVELAENAEKIVESGQSSWIGKDDKYLIETIENYDSSAKPIIIASSISPLKKIQYDFMTKMFIIFVIGLIFALCLSFFITRKIIKPLHLLQTELNKVKERRFSDVCLIKANGEVGTIADCVYELAQELDIYHHSQKEFLQNASHELKTPIMNIQGYAEGIRDEVFTGEKATKGLEIMIGECSRMKRMITEMLLLAKLESDKNVFKLQKVNINFLLKEVIEKLQLLANQHQVELEIVHQEGTDSFLYVDEDKLLQALLNIVSNGIRHAHNKVSITMETLTSNIMIKIKDDGEGIDEAIFPLIFHRFIKGKNGENGLGLAISRAIIERSNGKIQVENQNEGGATFQVTLPFIK
ncbi:sensor histidine kinase [Cytobacillus dafuensis]|uniref:histidine kinase n=1 Tax=Cytobacillus dafuensis TaxID=1742359 RepID=A0A5B8Z204_CYTDA|nr:HAMP domain-containing sensor histidine kinase [Cytobacillus dafuensis]QED46918.1 HAMP domain-containing histidine kinase [Cytobacillus dafuensis]